MNDPINPQHYKHLPAEAIDIITAAIAKAPSNESAYLQGQVLKYLLRCWEKKGIEDLRKAKWYLDRMVDGFDDLLAEASGATKTPIGEPDQDDRPHDFKVGDAVISWHGQEGVIEAINLIDDFPITVRHSIREQVSYKLGGVKKKHDEPPLKFYREPTLEDLKNGPIECEVLDSGGEQWKAMRLIEIHKSRSGRFGFFCQAERDSPLSCWEQCRIEVAE